MSADESQELTREISEPYRDHARPSPPRALRSCRWRWELVSLGWCYVEVRQTADGLGTLNTEEMNGPRVKPMAH